MQLFGPKTHSPSKWLEEQPFNLGNEIHSRSMLFVMSLAQRPIWGQIGTKLQG